MLQRKNLRGIIRCKITRWEDALFAKPGGYTKNKNSGLANYVTGATNYQQKNFSP